MPMIISALVDWIKFWSWAGLPGVLIDWQLITRVLSGRSVRPGVTLLGEEVATGLVKLRSDVSVLQVSFKYEKEFVVSKTVVSNRHVSKLGTPQWKHPQLTL